MKNKYFLSIALIFVISLFYSRFMVSVCMIAFTVLAIIEAQRSTTFSFRSFFMDKSFSGLILVFVAVLLSGFNSADQHEWLHQVKLKLPFVFLPFVFYVFKPNIDRRLHQWVHYVFIAVAFLSTFHVISSFFLDKEAIIKGLGKGRSIPTPLDHIHYSIMVAYALVSAAVLAIIETDKKHKWPLIIVSTYLFAFLHFLSVRTGLVLSYAGIILVLVWYGVTHKKYLLGLGITAILVAMPFIAYNTIAPLKKKINYMFWDLAQYKKGKGNSYSDSERLMSYEIAIDLIKESPIVGHGIGDLMPIMTQRHKEKFGKKKKYIYPHNQYLYILTCLGILGALMFFYGLFTPLIHSSKRNVFLISIFALMMISFLVENTIQRAVITGFFLFFILLNLCLEPSNEEEVSLK